MKINECWILNTRGEKWGANGAWGEKQIGDAQTEAGRPLSTWHLCSPTTGILIWGKHPQVFTITFWFGLDLKTVCYQRLVQQVKEIQDDIEKLRNQKMWDSKKVCPQHPHRLVLCKAKSIHLFVNKRPLKLINEYLSLKTLMVYMLIMYLKAQKSGLKPLLT